MIETYIASYTVAALRKSTFSIKRSSKNPPCYRCRKLVLSHTVRTRNELSLRIEHAFAIVRVWS